MYQTGRIEMCIYKESNGFYANVSEIRAITNQIICANNATANLNITAACINQTNFCSGWDMWKLDINYFNDSTYFRTLMPTEGEQNRVRWYIVDLLRETAVQTFIVLKDLTGDYTNAEIRMKAFINGTQQTIIEQPFDVSNKVTLYLLKNQVYTVCITNNQGTETCIGNMIADEPGTKTITLPNIEFATVDNPMQQNVSWSYNVDNLTDCTRYAGESCIIRFNYQDNERKTTYINWTLWQGMNNSGAYLYTNSAQQVLSFTSVYNSLAANTSYIACFSAIHQTLGNFTECYSFDTYYQEVLLPGWEDEQSGASGAQSLGDGESARGLQTGECGTYLAEHEPGVFHRIALRFAGEGAEWCVRARRTRLAQQSGWRDRGVSDQRADLSLRREQTGQ
jgi:hypothetical protein